MKLLCQEKQACAEIRAAVREPVRKELQNWPGFGCSTEGDRTAGKNIL